MQCEFATLLFSVTPCKHWSRTYIEKPHSSEFWIISQLHPSEAEITNHILSQSRSLAIGCEDWGVSSHLTVPFVKAMNVSDAQQTTQARSAMCFMHCASWDSHFWWPLLSHMGDHSVTKEVCENVPSDIGPNGWWSYPNWYMLTHVDTCWYMLIPSDND